MGVRCGHGSPARPSTSQEGRLHDKSVHGPPSRSGKPRCGRAHRRQPGLAARPPADHAGVVLDRDPVPSHGSCAARDVRVAPRSHRSLFEAGPRRPAGSGWSATWSPSSGRCWSRATGGTRHSLVRHSGSRPPSSSPPLRAARSSSAPPSRVVTFAAGWVIFGFASVRAGVFPRRMAVLMTIGGVAGVLTLIAPLQLPLAFAVGWMGSWLVRSDILQNSTSQRA